LNNIKIPDDVHLFLAFVYKLKFNSMKAIITHRLLITILLNILHRKPKFPLDGILIIINSYAD